MSELITPNEETKVGKIKFNREQFHSLAQSYVNTVYVSHGKSAPASDVDPGNRDPKLDKFAYNNFLLFLQRWNPNFQGDSQC